MRQSSRCPAVVTSWQAMEVNDYAEEERIQHPLPEWEEFVIGLLLLVVAFIAAFVFGWIPLR